jgi:hypothetical protein
MSVRVSDVMTAHVIAVGPEAFVHKAASNEAAGVHA